MLSIPINLDDLLHQRTIESVRIEYKATWDKQIEPKVLRTICAFANDLLNLNGGYIILGIETDGVTPQFPPRGLPESRLDAIMQDIRVMGKSRIEPDYVPIAEAVQYQGQWLIVVWVPPGENRPYKAKDDNQYTYFVRVGAETVKAEGTLHAQLIEQTARIPFDDRRHLQSTVLDISPTLVKRFLHNVKSDLLNRQPPLTDEDLYKAMRLLQPINGAVVPRNVALLFFSERPDKHFPMAYFEVVQFDSRQDNLEEQKFFGPLNEIADEVIRYLDNLTNVTLRKVPNQAQVERTVAFPYEALEEAVVNAVYHRSYESHITEPNKIYLYPDRIEIISYPGPVPGITLESLQDTPPPVPARNRRIGDFLKELRLAEMRGTGIPKIRRRMSENGSPQPRFDFTDSYFRVILPAHPRYVVVHALREGHYLWSIGERQQAIETLTRVWNDQSHIGTVAALLIDFHYQLGNDFEAQTIFSRFQQNPKPQNTALVYLAHFKGLMTKGDQTAATRIIEALPESAYDDAPLEVAIALKRVNLTDRAKRLRERLNLADLDE